MPRHHAHDVIAMLRRFGLVAALTATCATAVFGRETVEPNAIPSAQKRAYPGVVTIDVDATDIEHKLFRVHETVPVRSGPLVLLYPRWLPGAHGPYGDVGSIAGLQMVAGGKRLDWHRDSVETDAFRVEVPAGVDQLQMDFQFLSATSESSGHVMFTQQMLDIDWNDVLLYPAGYEVGGIAFATRLKLPTGWQFATALHGTPSASGWQAFDTVSLDTLVDSPLYAGHYFRRIELDPPGAARPAALDIVADSPGLLGAITDAQIEAHRQLVTQADRLFGARHFRHYDFLLSVSDSLGGNGLEHHESSEDGVKADYFEDWSKTGGPRDLLPHEFTHSWNGKFRRPADLWTPDFNTVPMRGSLLWVYEGQTEYWGHVLAARSALVTPEQARDELARAAAAYEHRVGRAWRNLQDTTNDPVLDAGHSSRDWRDYQRGYDYYEESALFWLDADTLIRERSHGQRSLDDFARGFFGIEDGSILVHTYTFADVVQALNAVMPFDWAGFLRERLDNHDHAPMDGLARSGWKLVYAEKETHSAEADDDNAKVSDFSYSLGLRIATEDDKLRNVLWDSPAFRAGLAPGSKLIAVNGVAYKPERLKLAITSNRHGDQPIDLLVRDGDDFRTVTIDYRDGLRYPLLERIAGTPDLLSAIEAAK